MPHYKRRSPTSFTSYICVFRCIYLATILVASTQKAFAASFTSIRSGSWSDPATWGNADLTNDPIRRLPSLGDDVFIAPGTIVIVDTSVDTRVNSVNVQSIGVLTCPRNAQLGPTPELGLTLSTLRVEGGGCFSCGHGNCTDDAEPFEGKFVLRLASNLPPASADDNVRTLMVESGGALFMSGAPRVKPVTRLTANVEVGQTILQVSDADIAEGPTRQIVKLSQPWRVGDRVAIAPTDLQSDQTEYGTIVGIMRDADAAGPISAQLTMADPLRYARNGRVLALVNKSDSNRAVTVDARAEIALLSRNVVIEGTNDAVMGLGGDVMLTGQGVRARLSWIEFRYLGRRGHLARYPLHIHNLGDNGRDVKVSNVAIHSSFQRGIVVHCTNSVELVNNTVAGVPGFAYMLEDGAEEGNTLIGNYAIDVKPSTYPLLQTERVNSAGFWFVNAANTFVGNVAAGVAGAGFSLDMDPVLANRPATLSTCPERLPGYNAKLEIASAEFNRAVNTALIKKEFERFENNVVHAAHTGLWMSYPFTPMFFVNRTAPLVRFSAWKIASRQSPSSQASDGVSIQFDGCMRLQGQRGMRIVHLTCVDAQSATWSSCVNTFDGTTVAWTSNEELKTSGVGPPPQPKTPGVMFTHLEPQAFLRTHIEFGSRSGPAAPLFVSTSSGGPLATLNTLSGVSIAIASSSFAAANLPALIQLKAGDMQVFTDETGDAFGAGPGAVVAATYSNASGVDPLVASYSGGQCTAGVYARERKSPHVSTSALPNGRTISVQGGLPMLCTGSPIRFVALNIERRLNGIKVLMSPVQIDRTWRLADGVVTSRRTSAFPILLPLNAASTSPLSGGYTLNFGPISGAGQTVVSLSPSITPSDGLTVRITGMPPETRFGSKQTWFTTVVQDGTATTCPQLAIACRTLGRSGKPMVCICKFRTNVSEALVRFQVSRYPRDVGWVTGKGDIFGIYDYGILEMEYW